MKKTIIIILIAVLAGLVLGYFLGASGLLFGRTGFSLGNNTYQAGWEAAKKRLADSGFAAPMADFGIDNVSGAVKEIKDNTIILKIRPLEPLADPDLDERLAEVNDNTKIYLSEQKDQAIYQKEMEEYNKKMQEQINNLPQPGQTPAVPANPAMPPEFFVKKQAGLSDIKIGDNINVIAADKDIKNAKQFTAAEINIQPAPAMAPTEAVPL